MLFANIDLEIIQQDHSHSIQMLHTCKPSSIRNRIHSHGVLFTRTWHIHRVVQLHNSFTLHELSELESVGLVPYIFDTGASTSVVPGLKGVSDLESLSVTLSGVGAIPIIGTGMLHLHVSCNLHANSSFQDMVRDQNNTVSAVMT